MTEMQTEHELDWLGESNTRPTLLARVRDWYLTRRERKDYTRIDALRVIQRVAVHRERGE